MCDEIEEVPGFRWDGKLHLTRRAAIDYGLGEIAAHIQKRHINDVHKGLLENRDRLIYLLTEHRNEELPATTPAEKDPLIPVPAKTDGKMAAVRWLVGEKKGKHRQAILDWLEEGGFENIADFENRATFVQKENFCAFMENL